MEYINYIILVEMLSNNYLSLWIAIIILSGAIIIYIIMHVSYKGFIIYIYIYIYIHNIIIYYICIPIIHNNNYFFY